MKEITITYGKGIPTENTVGNWYVDLLTDTKYNKLSGDWKVYKVDSVYTYWKQ